MKKINKILLALIFAVCATTFTSRVFAADFSLNNVALVCNPASVEAGQSTDCYIIGIPSGDTGSLHGFVAQAFTTKDLRLEGAAKKDGISGATSAFTKASAASSTEGTTELTVNNEKIQFRCSISSEGSTKGAVDYGCAVYYSTGTTDAFTKASITSNLSQSVQEVLPDTNKSAYGTIGSLKVSLDENSTAKDCGEVCLQVWNIENKSQYSNYQTCTDPENKDQCGGEQSSMLNGNNLFCEELHMLPIEDYGNPPATGSFVSYAVLIAGALIAISAVAMAKKNTRFNKI